MPKAKTATKSKPVDKAAEQLKLHKDTINKGTPIAAIKEKELEINKVVMAAQQKADQKIVKVREKAEKIRSEAIETAPGEAKQYLKDETAKAEKEAKIIEATIKPECEKVKKQGMTNYDKAVTEVMNIILPN